MATNHLPLPLQLTEPVLLAGDLGDAARTIVHTRNPPATISHRRAATPRDTSIAWEDGEDGRNGPR